MNHTDSADDVDVESIRQGIGATLEVWELENSNLRKREVDIYPNSTDEDEDVLIKKNPGNGKESIETVDNVDLSELVDELSDEIESENPKTRLSGPSNKVRSIFGPPYYQ